VPTFGQAEGGHGWPAGWGGSGSVRLMSHGDRPVIVAMIPMWMMQVVVYQVVNVITVRNGLMWTAGTVYMRLVMSAAVMTGRTSIGICGVDFKHVIVNVI
jgi:hypothetical protein